MIDPPPLMILMFGLGAGFLLSDLLWIGYMHAVLKSIDQIKKRLRIDE
jgi:hypothetical protein